VSSDSFPTSLTLRFPRITRLRMDGDAKEPHDIESDVQLWQRFNEVTAQRSAPESLNGVSFESSSDSPYGCRFLTESQTLRQKKQARTTNKIHYQPLVPVAAAETTLLAGKTFAVLDGRYSLHEDEIELSSATVQGWYGDAARVASQGDVHAFIKRHGGVVRLTPLNEICVLGGMWSNVRVLAYKGGREKGILRWTYVYREVARLQAAPNAFRNDEHTFENESNEPTLLDYIVLPRMQQEDGVARNADSQGDRASRRIASKCKIMDSLDLMRALRCVGHDRLSRPSEEVSWQRVDVENLRDIISPMRKFLWPGGLMNLQVVLYPDIFRDDFGLSEEHGMESRLHEAESSRSSNRIQRTIHLAQAMGANVTYHVEVANGQFGTMKPILPRLEYAKVFQSVSVASATRSRSFWCRRRT
jgi:hypothetical protein